MVIDIVGQHENGCAIGCIRATGEDVILSVGSIDLRALLSTSSEKLDLDENSQRRLTKAGLTTLGLVASVSERQLQSILESDESLDATKAKIADVGLSLGLRFDPELLTDSSTPLPDTEVVNRILAADCDEDAEQVVEPDA